MGLESLIFQAGLAMLAASATASTAIAQDAFPTKPVTIIAAFPPGGTVDLLARAAGAKLQEDWNQRVIVENRPGASGIIGSQAVAKAAPDGYTLMVVPITHVTNASLYSRLPFDPLADFTPISLLASQPIMLVVNPAQPIKSVGDLIALAKANPGKLNCASGGNGTSQHLACELFKSSTGVNIAHVPYKGNAPAMVDVMGGQVEMLFDQMATAVPHVKGGRVRAIAVTSAQRSPAMPEVPTVAESGVPGFETEAWFGLVGPAGMPGSVVEQIQQSFAKVLAQPQIKETLSAQGLTLIAGSPKEFGTFMRVELAKWAKVIKESGVRLD